MFTISTSTAYDTSTNGKVVSETLLKKMDRFELRKPAEGSDPYGDIIESCYHLDTAAKYGLCHTFGSPPYNWGFCSRSCDFEYDSPYHRRQDSFEETTMEIFENYPEGAETPPGNNSFSPAFIVAYYVAKNSFM